MKKVFVGIVAAILIASILLTGAAFAQGSRIRITGASTNIRKSASINGKIIAVVAKGAVFDSAGGKAVDNRGVTWYQVNYKGTPGWVSSKYAKPEGGSTPVSGKQVTAVKGKAYIRSDCNKNAKILGTLQRGASLSYAGTTKKDSRGVKWYSVNYKGQTGWVSSKYAKLR